VADPVEAEQREDAALVAALAHGERSALAALYDRHAAALLGVAHAVLGNRRDAEDLLHDVFLEVWRRAASYDASRASVRAWLLLRTRSRAIDRFRSLALARRHGMALAAEPPAGSDPASELWPVLDRPRALAALSALPEPQRQAIELSYREGLSCSEIAERCGVPVGTVKSRLARAMETLREQLRAGGDTD
jgi:RNA polymerase sigma-70 factor (ECF subfamily)